MCHKCPRTYNWQSDQRWTHGPDIDISLVADEKNLFAKTNSFYLSLNK